eukprot:604470-Ditylum_brightwellii.AAC.1
MLCKPRHLMNPLVSPFGANSAWVEAVIQEQRKWETMPKRQEPLTVEMTIKVYTMGKKEHNDSFIAAFRDWLIVGIYTGNRKSEWAQGHQIGCSGKFAILDVKLGVMDLPKPLLRRNLSSYGRMKIKYFRSSNTTLCPVRAGHRMSRKAQRLKIDSILQSVAKSIYSLTKPEDIRRGPLTIIQKDRSKHAGNKHWAFLLASSCKQLDTI